MSRCARCGRSVPGEIAGDAALAKGSPAGADLEGEDPQQLCPGCASELAEAAPEPEQVHAKAPWHFKLLAVGTAGYLAYRLYQGIGWLIHHA